jgi:hypothetical protein
MTHCLRLSSGGGSIPTQTTNLFLLEDLEDLEDSGRTSELAESDLDALQAVADWIKTFVVKPHKDLGRAGPVCPFVPGALERKTLWLAPEQIADEGVPDVVELINGYKSLFLDAQPTDGDDAIYKVIVVVFTDLSADGAQGVFDDVPTASCSSVVCGRWNRVRAATGESTLLVARPALGRRPDRSVSRDTAAGRDRDASALPTAPTSLETSHA